MDLVTEQRLNTRRRILGTARQMIAERGYDAITVRDLAHSCGVSVPTLYNQLGGKDQVLAAAIEDHFLADAYQAEIRRSLTGLERILAVLDHITGQFLAAPAFHRRMLEAFASLDSTTRVQERISQQLAAEIARELARMQRDGLLIEWVDTPALAGQVTAGFISAAVVWGSGTIPEQSLPASVRYAVSLVLLGVTAGAARETLETTLKTAQASLAHEREEQLHGQAISQTP